MLSQVEQWSKWSKQYQRAFSCHQCTRCLAVAADFASASAPRRRAAKMVSLHVRWYKWGSAAEPYQFCKKMTLTHESLLEKKKGGWDAASALTGYAWG